jgi:hypothetical protein
MIIRFKYGEVIKGREYINVYTEDKTTGEYLLIKTPLDNVKEDWEDSK